MSKETIRETVNTIKSVDGMKAVKVAFELLKVSKIVFQKLCKLLVC